MYSQKTMPVVDFARHVFIVSKVLNQREAARKDVYSQLQKMRKSIITMSLSYSDIDRLRQKIDSLIDWERKYARFFKPQDSEISELKSRISMLEEEINKEREENLMNISEKEEKVAELTESINNIKNSMKHLMLEKAKRSHRLKFLEKKINKKVDRGSYYSS